MKNCTDLGQSRKLAEFLSFESADMHYNNVSIKGINYVDEHRAEFMEYNRAIKVLSKYTVNPLFEVIPCWSLAALFRIIKNCLGYTMQTTYSNNVIIVCEMGEKPYTITTNEYDNEVDACVEMIVTLHEQNLL